LPAKKVLKIPNCKKWSINLKRNKPMQISEAMFIKYVQPGQVKGNQAVTG